jgi:pyruvyl transferase EpsO
MRVVYVSSARSYRRRDLVRSMGAGGPIFLVGGYFGDFWGAQPRGRLAFFLSVIGEFKDHPIVLLPQSISFEDSLVLAEARAAIRNHPNLKVFVRDAFSYERARSCFGGSELILCPDTVFHLAGQPWMRLRGQSSRAVLYLKRQDWASRQDFSPSALGMPWLEVSDWASFDRDFRSSVYIPGLNRLIREVWQRRLAIGREWVSRRKWLGSHPFVVEPRPWPRQELNLRSLGLAHSGIYHLAGRKVVITNRLHGHILSTLLGIPHVLLLGPYRKMESFFQTWTNDVEFCRFSREPGAVRAAFDDLLSRSQNAG